MAAPLPTTKTAAPEAPQARQKPPRTAVTESLEDILYGSLAGVLGKYIEYPFDTVKVRLQSQSDHLPLRYNGPLDCFKQSLRADGFVGLYRGISAPLVGAALETSSLFFFERIGREALVKAGVLHGEGRGPVDEYGIAERPPLAALWFTGAFSGFFTSFILTPVELVKCRVQVPGGGASVPVQSPLAVIRYVFRHEGLLGFWHGQMGTLIREAGGSAAWFGAKETSTNVFRRLNMEKATTRAEKQKVAASPLPLWQQAVAGATAGVSYNFLFFPADTVKSRMQTTPMGGGDMAVARRTFWGETTALWQQAGWRGFYRGCGVTCLRSGPSSAVIFMIYDGLKKYMPL